MTTPLDERLTALLSALDKLPPHHGLSYRGYTGRQGQTFQRAIPSAVLVSTSRDPRVATDNFSTDGVYAVIGRRGRDLTSVSERPHEQEVVFRPGSVYLPIERFDVDGLEVAVVEELDPGHTPETHPTVTLDQLKDQMTEAIRDARERPPVDDVTPGKFSGPLA
ncbi:hypothetical protein [Nocardioides cynanchi]|uniref:hypothetical protein n=1 Tax=Nocardioides cynanchi TaxID=2558918 RepID=UPI0012492866|nr:hypothetical protein [Nocardioides cynanchi]